MKKVNLNGKLSLNKETIAKLNNEQMNVVKGGRPNTNTCGSGCMIAPLCKRKGSRLKALSFY